MGSAAGQHSVEKSTVAYWRQHCQRKESATHAQFFLVPLLLSAKPCAAQKAQLAFLPLFTIMVQGGPHVLMTRCCVLCSRMFCLMMSQNLLKHCP